MWSCVEKETTNVYQFLPTLNQCHTLFTPWQCWVTVPRPCLMCSRRCGLMHSFDPLDHPGPLGCCWELSWFTSNALERGIKIVGLEEGVDWEGTEPKQEWLFFPFFFLLWRGGIVAGSREWQAEGVRGISVVGGGEMAGSQRESCTWKGEWMAWSER